MDALLFWPLIGGLIGFCAAQKKGWHPAAGIIGGMLLGILSPLLFFLSGITGADPKMRKCPLCAEWVKEEALVCKHCGKDLPALSKPAERVRYVNGKPIGK